MINFGNHFRIVVKVEQRENVRSFFKQALSCLCVVQNKDSDVFKFENNVYFGVYYLNDGNEMLSLEQYKNACWAELKTDNVEELKRNIINSGCTPVDYFDKGHFYFHAPWGQVFRIAHIDE